MIICEVISGQVIVGYPFEILKVHVVTGSIRLTPIPPYRIQPYAVCQ